MCLFAFGFSLVSTLQSQTPRKDLTQASLEDLMNVQVTSVSKKEQKLSKTGAAVFVISQDDIRRSGVTNIPDLLRMVPGVNVARINAHTWSISIRGFSDLYGNKVLVMIDGRPMYRQSFSGVRWDEVDVPLENIERIEVIRGPGGTVWGANAVNGVINIITKSAWATQGGMISAAAGLESVPDTTAQFGGTAGGRTAYRVYGRFVNTRDPDGEIGEDRLRRSHAGFRIDRDLSSRDSVTIEGDATKLQGGDAFSASTLGILGGDSVVLPARYTSGTVRGLWSHALKNGGQISLQIYDDYYKRLDRGLTENRNTIDFAFEHHLKLGGRQDLVWGLGYRRTTDEFSASFNPARRADSLYSGFVQDEIRLMDVLWLTVGAKFEHNAYTGYEDEPSAQLVWTPSARQTVWASAGRAVRQPARFESDLVANIPGSVLPGGVVAELILRGNPHLEVEQLRAFEGGYRVTAGRRVSLDLSAFSYYYQDLVTRETSAPSFVLMPAPPHLILPVNYDSQGNAHSLGAEISANWTPVDRWRLTAGYTHLHIRSGLAPSSNDLSQQIIAGSSPTHRVDVGSYYNLTRSLDLDARFSYTGGLRAGPVPGFAGLNLRVGWRFTERGEFSLAGQNLLQSQHPEFPDVDGLLRTEVDRAVTAKFAWRF